MCVKILNYKVEITDGEFSIVLERGGHMAGLLTRNGTQNFVFKDKISKETLHRWQSIAYLLLAAVEEIKQDYGKKD